MKFKILIVDDDPNLRILLRQMLQLRDFAVVEAEDGIDALKQVAEAKPDAIILDVMMPNMDGIALCRRLRSQPETEKVPIIMLSGKAQRQAIEEGLAAGANKYLCKPVPFGQLIEHVRAVLQDEIALQS